MRYGVIGLSVLGLVSVLAGCGDKNNGGAGTGASAGDGASGGGAGTAAPGAPDYAAVSVILGGMEQGTSIGSCAAGSCHGGQGAGQAHLNFKKADLATTLVDVMSCENNAMKLVVPGKPEESWLWIKLTAEIEDKTDGKIIHEGTPSACVGVITGFGSRMPFVAGSFDKLSDEKLKTIHDWILGGAPGPT